jgi:curved DNA-binding protein CbpA
VTAAYRRMAKRYHPDQAGSDGEVIRDVNAAYAMLRDGLTARAPGRAAARRRAAQPRRGAGWWLAPVQRRTLGDELLRALAPMEEVRLVASAATWDAHDVRLVLTDRRLVWLRDDALGDRVRSLALGQLEEVRSRRGRRSRTGELRLRTRDGGRLSFAELRLHVLAALERALQPPPRPADIPRRP